MTAKISYKSSPKEIQGKSPGALVDGGANGGFGGDDVLVIDWGDRTALVTGIDGHTFVDLPLVTYVGLIHTTNGPAIAVMHQYAYHGKGKTIHAPTQMAHYGHDVNDKSIRSPCGTGKQRIITPDGHFIPLDIVDGLPYMPMSQPTEEDMDNLPHIILTGDMDWDPRCLDNACTIICREQDSPYGALMTEEDFNEHFAHRIPLTGEIISFGRKNAPNYQDPRGHDPSYTANHHKISLKDPKYGVIHSDFVGRKTARVATGTHPSQGAVKMPLPKVYQNESAHTHPNHAEQGSVSTKHSTRRVKDGKRTPGNMWVLPLIFLCILLNTFTIDHLGTLIPLNAVRSRNTTKDPNLRLSPIGGGEGLTPCVQTHTKLHL
jgi:hypothetical protein